MRTRYNIHITNLSDIDILDVDLMQAGAIQTLIILLKDKHNIDIEYDIIDSESDEQLLEDENEDYMSMAHEEDDLWDDLIEETDYLEEDDE